VTIDMALRLVTHLLSTEPEKYEI